MLLLKLLRYIQGYAVFTARGGFPERFVNLCARNSVPLWSVEYFGGTLNAHTTAYALKDIEIISEKSGMELEITRISSLKQTLKKHKNRKALLIALVLCVCVTVFLSFFIWSISVEGNEKYTREEILAVFEDQGVKIGSLKSKIDTKAVSDNAVSVLSDLSWAKVNIRGCFAVIEVRESIKKPELVDEQAPVNIVAGEDGQIIRYEVSKGEPVKKAGIAVTKGELLVSGVLTNSDGSERLVHSLARITAKVTHKVNSPFSKKLYSVSDETVKFSAFFFGITLPKYKEADDFFESRKYLDNNNKILPAGIFRYRAAEYENEYELTFDDLSLINAFSFNKEAVKINGKAESIIKSKIKKNGERFEGVFICEEEIGVQQEILLG